MASLLHLAHFSHLIFEECHSELCGVFGISRDIIFFHERLISFSDTGTKRGKAQSDHIETLCFHYNHLAGGYYSRI